MGALLIPVIAVIVLLFVLAAGAKAWGSRRQHLASELADKDAPTLDYEVPVEQDPSVVLMALEREGYDAAPDPRNSRLVHVSCPAGADRDRARVRAVIASVHSTGIDSGAPFDAEQVRFRDER